MRNEFLRLGVPSNESLILIIIYYKFRGLWFSYEWYNLSKEDSLTRVLLDEYGKGLYLNSETVSSVPNTWES